MKLELEIISTDGDETTHRVCDNINLVVTKKNGKITRERFEMIKVKYANDKPLGVCLLDECFDQLKSSVDQNELSLYSLTVNKVLLQYEVDEIPPASMYHLLRNINVEDIKKRMCYYFVGKSPYNLTFIDHDMNVIPKNIIMPTLGLKPRSASDIYYTELFRNVVESEYTRYHKYYLINNHKWLDLVIVRIDDVKILNNLYMTLINDGICYRDQLVGVESQYDIFDITELLKKQASMEGIDGR